MKTIEKINIPEQPILSPNPTTNKYELEKDFSIAVKDITIVVPQYFEYDGASIPKIAWPFTFSPFAPDVMVPALVHDWLYYNHQTSRQLADEIFGILLASNGVANGKVNTMQKGAENFGKKHWALQEGEKQYLKELYAKVKNSPNVEAYQFPPEITSQFPNNNGTQPLA